MLYHQKSGVKISSWPLKRVLESLENLKDKIFLIFNDKLLQCIIKKRNINFVQKTQKKITFMAQEGVGPVSSNIIMWVTRNFSVHGA